MIADYNAETKIATFQSVSGAKVTNEHRRQIAAKSRQKLRILIL